MTTVPTWKAKDMGNDTSDDIRRYPARVRRSLFSRVADAYHQWRDDRRVIGSEKANAKIRVTLDGAGLLFMAGAGAVVSPALGLLGLGIACLIFSWRIGA